MGWNRRSFLGASIATATALPLTSVLPRTARAASDLTLNFEDAGGSTRNTGADNNKAYTHAVRYLDRRGGGTLLVPAKLYPFSGTCALVACNVTVLGYGATFAGENCRLAIKYFSEGYNIHGLTLLETTGTSSSYLLDCAGSNCHFKDLHLEKAPPAGGYIGYCREVTFGNTFENVSFAGANGIFIGGHDHQITGGWGESLHGDDCWSLKSTTNPCYNIRISGFQARGFAAIVSIGSEIGTLQTDNPSRNLFVKNVSIENCSADECVYLVYIKPGGVNTNDYRDGVVEDVLVSNCTLTDAAGKKFRNGVYLSPGRGAIVRRLTVRDLTIKARGSSPAVQTVSGLYLCPLRSTDAAGQGASIEDVSISGVRCIDPFGGAAMSPSTPGVPLQSLISIEKLDPAVGHVGAVQISNSMIEGCARMAAYLGPNLEGPIAFAGCTFDNFAAAISSSIDKGSVLAMSPVSLTEITAVPSSSAPADTRGVMSDSKPDKTVTYTGDTSQVSLPSIEAGSPLTSAIFTSSRDTWISGVSVSASAGVAASGLNFVRFTLRNSSNGKILGSVTTANGFLGEANASYPINGDLQFGGSAADIPEGSQLILEITHGGSGAAARDPTITVHCVPFGGA